MRTSWWWSERLTLRAPAATIVPQRLAGGGAVGSAPPLEALGENPESLRRHLPDDGEPPIVDAPGEGLGGACRQHALLLVPLAVVGLHEQRDRGQAVREDP